MAEVVTLEIKALAKKYGIERLGFLTLTFPDHVTDFREAQRRFKNIQRRVLTTRYLRAIAVRERSKNRRIHYHLVVVLRDDIRTGFDFEAVEKQDYRSAGKSLRSEWAFWRNTAKRYRFGRTELLPVRSTAEGIARYVGKYIAKHVRAREQQDTGFRMVSFINYKVGTRTANANFCWNTVNGRLWRLKVKAFLQSMHCKDTEELKAVLGSRWCYHALPAILAQNVTEQMIFESREEAERIATRELIQRLQPAVLAMNAQSEYRQSRGTPPGRVYSLSPGRSFTPRNSCQRERFSVSGQKAEERWSPDKFHSGGAALRVGPSRVSGLDVAKEKYAVFLAPGREPMRF